MPTGIYWHRWLVTLCIKSPAWNNSADENWYASASAGDPKSHRTPATPVQNCHQWKINKMASLDTIWNQNGVNRSFIHFRVLSLFNTADASRVSIREEELKRIASMLPNFINLEKLPWNYKNRPNFRNDFPFVEEVQVGFYTADYKPPFSAIF